MKRIVIALFILPVLNSCGEAESEEILEPTENQEIVEIIEEPVVVNSFIIKSNEVGIFTLGHPVPGKLPEELKIRQGSIAENFEGEEIVYEVSMIFNHLEDVVDLKLENSDVEHHEDKNIIEMTVHSNYYETENGITNGSTIQEFMDSYEDYSLWYSYVGDIYVLETPQLENVQFLLDAEDYTKVPSGKSDMEELIPEDFVEGASIVSIRIF